MVSARVLLSAGLLGAASLASAFQPGRVHHTRRTAALRNSASDVEDYLAANCPSASALLSKTGAAMKKILKDGEGEFSPSCCSSSRLLFAHITCQMDIYSRASTAEGGFTIFAPNEAAFEDLGDKLRSSLDDVRNDEMAEKIASYHVIAEPVTSDQLFNSGGVVTEGGEVPAERSVSGGFFGVGGKEVRFGAYLVHYFLFADNGVHGY